MTTLIADSETDGLLASVTKLHLLQLGDADTDEVTLYSDDPTAASLGLEAGLQNPILPLSDAFARMRSADRIVFHNYVGYDRHILAKFAPGVDQPSKTLDTLVMARLAFPEERTHNLRDWGERLNCPKDTYDGDYQSLDVPFLLYSEQDIIAGRRLWHHVKHVLDWGQSCALEHDVARAIDLQEKNGFCFDVQSAQALDAILRQEVADLTAGLQVIFPPLTKTETFIPKVNNKTRGYVKGVPFIKSRVEVFNPDSRVHIGERLMLAGWKPKAFGADGAPTVDEKTLAAMHYPPAKALMEQLKASKKLAMLSDGKQGWLRLVQPDGRIYGRVNPNGACTGRMSHFKPNVAQADKDPRMRSLWGPRQHWKLVGCDAEGLEARMLGHYLTYYDGGVFSDRVVNGSSDDRSDVHSANLRGHIKAQLLPPMAWESGFKIARGGSNSIKTILYALMYGAGDFKLGETLKAIWRDLGEIPPAVPSKELGRQVRAALARSMIGMDKLVEKVIERIVSPGYLIGLDGRHVPSRSPHSALNTLLQGAGAIVMKHALRLFMAEHEHLYGDYFALCANIHDEVQLECEPSVTDLLGGSLADCIRQAGVDLGVRCALAGKYSVGDNWSQTH